MSPTLVTVGDNCLDVYLTHDLLAVGGNALNVAVQWRRSGGTARYLGAVGDDREGVIVCEEVVAAGLAAEDLETRPGQTGVTLMSHESGDRSFLLEDLGVGERYVPPQQRYDELVASDWIHLGTNSDPALVQRLAEDRVRFSVDISTVHGAVPLRGVPLVFASGPDAPGEPVEPMLRALLAAGAHRAVVTCGARGAFFADATTTVHEPAAPVEVLDTCGAGDSFIAAFLASYCVGSDDAPAALRRAAAAAAETCDAPGRLPAATSRGARLAAREVFRLHHACRGPEGTLMTYRLRRPTVPGPADRSYWLQSIGADAVTEPLTGDDRADVVVVGGGYTGLWTALRIRELAPEARVIVLEADFCGSGASGRNGGQVHTWWAEVDLLSAVVGVTEARELCAATVDVIDELQQLQSGGLVDMDLRLDGWLWTAELARPGRGLGARRRDVRRGRRQTVRAAGRRGDRAPHRFVGLLRGGCRGAGRHRPARQAGRRPS